MTDLPPLSDVIRRHGLSARRALGQNFILDANLNRKIVRQAGELSGYVVLEVGAGPGGLTRAILETDSAHVVAIERDTRCIDALEELRATVPGRLTILAGDALELDFAGIAAGFELPVRVIANLPYNIATELYAGWLTADPWPPWYDSLTLMFQKEVAERIVAAPGRKAFGRLSVLTGWRGRAVIKMRLPPAAFTPQPKVASALVHYEPGAPVIDDLSVAELERISAILFGQRRKMLRGSLRQLTSDPEDVLRPLRIDPQSRIETLTVKEICQIAKTLSLKA